ncbi:hypothetical protein SAMN05444156_2957 [Verrucomicrobium sp. GAS474]|uniref:hypothetical protein n=1 Tax=Verrucomicrobium sp. GAS474 TaxID=1882831 RepID=UPI00087B6917|nr:hypothetical protein [Verrucomicrobium sp. GAS474]SDU26729.1 hypothetical protein SAMN05444156_2957 [Verrucomicrobium sp. GAS474]
MIDWLPLLCGVVLLLLGRTLFWVGVAVIGAVIGWQLGLQWLVGRPWWMELLAAVAGAGLGIVLAICFQPLAAAWVGFFAGGAAVCEIAFRLGLVSSTGPDWAPPVSLQELGRFIPHIAPNLPFIIGGILGAVLALVLFDWGLIVLSSLYGASLIVRSCGIAAVAGGAGRTGLIVFAVLAAIGITVQAMNRAGNRAVN